MKSYCKNIDITDTDFIESAIWDCLKHRDTKDYSRVDVQRVIKDYRTIDQMAREMSRQLKTHDLYLPPVKRDTRRDKSNGKLRDIDIEDIWQQFFDYVAAHGLDPMLCRLGYYQCGCVDGKGQIWGVQILHGWMQKYRYFTHSDIRKCYPSIPQDRLFAFLEKYVKNDDLLWLIRTLVTHTTSFGISIGSRLSITLCQLYLSQAYHHMTEEFFKTRRGKRINYIPAMLIFMDDIYMASNSPSNLQKGQKELTRYIRQNLGMEIKPDWTLIDSQTATLDCMGFRTQKDYTKMRRKNYIKTRTAIENFRKHPSMDAAQDLMSRKTNIKYSDSYRFRKKYQWKQTSQKARRLISHESKIHGKTAGADEVRGWQYNLLPDRAQPLKGESHGPADQGDTHRV